MNTHHVRRQFQRLVCKPLSKRRFLHYTDISHSTLNLPRKKQNGWLKGKRGKKRCLSQRKVLRGRQRKQQQTQRGTLNVHDELSCLFHFQITLFLAFLDTVLKKTKAIISIQFAPSLHMNTDRLSYFGHAPSRGCERQEGR